MQHTKQKNNNTKSVKAKTVKQVRKQKVVSYSQPKVMFTNALPTTSYGKSLLKKPMSFKVSSPMNLSTPHIEFTRRFSSSSAGGGSVLFSDMHNQMIMAVTTVLGYCPLIVWRIRRIRMWCSAVTTTEGFVSLTPISMTSDNISPQSPPQTYRDETTTIDVPAHLNIKPDPTTPLGSWHYTTTTGASAAIFVIEYGDPAIMDIKFEGILNLNSTPGNYTRTLVGATVGAIYGAPITTHMLPDDVNYL